MALTAAGSGQPAVIYVNGVADGNVAQMAPGIGAITSLFLCGDQYGQPVNGVCDEILIADTALSADRIGTEYNNQSNPSGFYVPGAWMQTAADSSQVFFF